MSLWWGVCISGILHPLALAIPEVPLVPVFWPASLDPHSLPPSLPQDSGGWTPIIWAAEHKHIDVIRMLLTRGADVTLTDNVRDTRGLRGLVAGSSGTPV